MTMEQMRKRFSQDTDLYNPRLMGSDPRFGDIPGVRVGATFETRADCAAKGIHKALVAGISGSATEGARSICVSSAYEDDKDEGDTITYTGTGGKRDSFSGDGPQVSDQTFEHRDNAALKRSCETGKPVRVVRGPNPQSKYASVSGYRYDGLYIVKKAYMSKGKRGLDVCRYELQRVPGQPAIPVKRGWDGA
ncbi:hypothetical protein M413DRAFT_443244 [Hebeloma cylindrosporum]|uniref:YDG domain-containing protein n=1 Tax=Hebeloma cylindrosporum TaxID=76867 RepID=A0A0C3CJF5_HEBCY|nr:hypothetical protein M413DRAFT_443244 [Hebeloma cylindrosporum h7]